MSFATPELEMFQYFVAIVPTIYVDNRRAFGQKVLLTNQYAVTDYSRELTGQVTGVPGKNLAFALHTYPQLPI